ncbi:type 4b pilus protein PilO2 [Marinobacter subterrani]|uniref:type 4b pilus protein PilO2 n=1 Tax=Marinobacter subterrani TaxID=1658765 RepID=UPI00235785FE|nr:type 4b pilus protein PilO2 [Marinobacter subterrani]
MPILKLLGDDGSPAEECVVGLTWETVGKSEWKTQKKAAKKEGRAAVEIPVTNNDQSMINTGTIDKQRLPSGTSPSLAAWVAYTFKSGTIIAVERGSTESDEENVWFCAVRDGQVVSGTDVLDTWEAIDSQVSEIVAMFGDDGDLGFIGTEAPRLSAYGLSESEANPLVSTLPKSTRKKALIAGSRNSNGLLIAGITGLILTIVAGGGWYFFVAESGADLAAQAKKRRMMQVQRAEKDFAQLVADINAKSQAGRGLERIIESGVGKALPRIGGWNLQTAECATNSCTLIYKNEDLTDPGVLTGGMGEVCDSLSFEIKGAQATCAMSYENVPIAKKSADSLPQMSAEQIKAFRSDLMALAQDLENVSYSISPSSQVQFSGARYLNGVTLSETGSWGLAFPVGRTPLIVNTLKRYPTLTLEELKLNWSGKSIEIMGTYYRKGES